MKNLYHRSYTSRAYDEGLRSSLAHIYGANILLMWRRLLMTVEFFTTTKRLPQRPAGRAIYLRIAQLSWQKRLGIHCIYRWEWNYKHILEIQRRSSKTLCLQRHPLEVNFNVNHGGELTVRSFLFDKQALVQHAEKANATQLEVVDHDVSSVEPVINFLLKKLLLLLN